MPFERFVYLVLEQREMVCQHVVKKSRDSHLVATDYMKHLLYAVVVLLADIDLLAESCRDVGPAYEYGVIIQFSGLLFLRLRSGSSLECEAGGETASCIASFGGGEVAFPSVLLASGGMLVSSSRNELITASLSMSSILVFFAMPFSF